MTSPAASMAVAMLRAGRWGKEGAADDDGNGVTGATGSWITGVSGASGVAGSGIMSSFMVPSSDESWMKAH
jgi:hypothetical protein